LRILVLNAGSSSLKASVLEADARQPVAGATVAWGSDATRVAHRAATVEQALDELWAAGIDADSLDGVGHRMVHGGPTFRDPTLIDDAMLAVLDELGTLAPLHNAVALDTIRAVRSLLPDLPQVAAFDTGFHAGLPEDAFVYPLPWGWYADWGIRRYGFHGLSVAWSVRRAGELLEREPADLRLVVAHLGSGCSVTAVECGRSMATSMGLTPLEGLAMGTRAGSFDPGIVPQLLREGRMTLDELSEALDHGSGLLGVSGVSGDVREVTDAARAGSDRAELALAIFVRRAAEGIAAAATSLSGVDALVFTGGIGEHAAELRARIVGRLAPLGIDPIGIEPVTADAVLSAASATPAVLRIEAREDLVIAEAVEKVLRAAS
jgi:acetate kinase